MPVDVKIQSPTPPVVEDRATKFKAIGQWREAFAFTPYVTIDRLKEVIAAGGGHTTGDIVAVFKMDDKQFMHMWIEFPLQGDCRVKFVVYKTLVEAISKRALPEKHRVLLSQDLKDYKKDW